MNKTIIAIVVAILFFGGLVWFASPSRERSGIVQPDRQNTDVSLSANDDTGLLASAILTVEEASNYDFGTISMAKGIVKHQFKIKNTSTKSVTIDKMYTSCMCTTATLTKGDKQFGPYGMPGHGAIPKIGQTINPDEEISVDVFFDPAAHGPAGVGRIQRAVTIENNVGRPVELLFAAMVTP